MREHVFPLTLPSPPRGERDQKESLSLGEGEGFFLIPLPNWVRGQAEGFLLIPRHKGERAQFELKGKALRRGLSR